MPRTSCLAIVLLVILACTTVLGQSRATNDWENPRVLDINKLPPRSAYWSAPDEIVSRKATYGQAEASPWVNCLNGNWRFHWAKEPAQRPTSFFRPEYDDSHWDRLPVPSNWQLRGYGTPIYVNFIYPFRVDPPRVMGEPDRRYTSYVERNPVGSYRRSFDVPPAWSGQRVYLHFAGVSSAMYVWVNGKPVGFSKDSMSPAEFEITALLKPGENQMQLTVPAGEVTSGVVYDYLRLELDEKGK